MGSSSYENWDETINNWYLALNNCDLVAVIREKAICNRQWYSSGQLKVWDWSVSITKYLDRLECLVRLECLDRLEWLNSLEHLDRLECLDWLDLLYWQVVSNKSNTVVRKSSLYFVLSISIVVKYRLLLI